MRNRGRLPYIKTRWSRNCLYHAGLAAARTAVLAFKDVVIPALAMLTVCCSITSCMAVRSNSSILSNSSIAQMPISASTWNKLTLLLFLRNPWKQSDRKPSGKWWGIWVKLGILIQILFGMASIKWLDATLWRQLEFWNSDILPIFLLLSSPLDLPLFSTYWFYIKATDLTSCNNHINFN